VCTGSVNYVRDASTRTWARGDGARPRSPLSGASGLIARQRAARASLSLSGGGSGA
jgi:hypothetical protein